MIQSGGKQSLQQDPAAWQLCPQSGTLQQMIYFKNSISPSRYKAIPSICRVAHCSNLKNFFVSVCLLACHVMQEQVVRKQVSAVVAEEVVTAGELDLLATRHKGQYALRKLYHESSRLLAVFYTSPSCGPCRTLKPIFNGVIDEYGDKVQYYHCCHIQA